MEPRMGRIVPRDLRRRNGPMSKPADQPFDSASVAGGAMLHPSRLPDAPPSSMSMASPKGGASAERGVMPHMRGQVRVRDLDRLIAWLAARQRGAVAHWQLKEWGISDNAIDMRIRKGLLIPIFRGVYA